MCKLSYAWNIISIRKIVNCWAIAANIFYKLSLFLFVCFFFLLCKRVILSKWNLMNMLFFYALTWTFFLGPIFPLSVTFIMLFCSWRKVALFMVSCFFLFIGNIFYFYVWKQYACFDWLKTQPFTGVVFNFIFLHLMPTTEHTLVIKTIHCSRSFNSIVFVVVTNRNTEWRGKKENKTEITFWYRSTEIYTCVYVWWNVERKSKHDASKFSKKLFPTTSTRIQYILFVHQWTKQEP